MIWGKGLTGPGLYYKRKTPPKRAGSVLFIPIPMKYVFEKCYSVMVPASLINTDLFVPLS